MEKNQMKMYDAPIVEVVELEISATLLAGSTNADGVGSETPGQEY